MRLQQVEVGQWIFLFFCDRFSARKSAYIQQSNIVCSTQLSQRYSDNRVMWRFWIIHDETDVHVVANSFICLTDCSPQDCSVFALCLPSVVVSPVSLSVIVSLQALAAGAVPVHYALLVASQRVSLRAAHTLRFARLLLAHARNWGSH